MIALTKSTSDPGGAITIKEYKEDSSIRDADARVSKSKTLDGGVTVIHNGFAEGDRNIVVSARLSKNISDALWSFFKSETFVNLAIPGGVFNAAISKLKIDRGDARMTIEIESKMSA